MTCKDCFRYEECKQFYIDACLDSNTAEWDCFFFTDKSKIIELPCKVGDTVYIVDEYSDENRGYDKCKIKAFHFNGCFVYFEVDIDEIDMFDVSYIGKTVFLSKADAENKLKGGKI